MDNETVFRAYTSAKSDMRFIERIRNRGLHGISVSDDRLAINWRKRNRQASTFSYRVNCAFLRIAKLEKELADFRAAVEIDQAADKKQIDNLQTELAQTERAMNIVENAAQAHFKMAREQAEKVKTLRNALVNVVNSLPASEIELAREVWGNSNTDVVNLWLSCAKQVLKSTKKQGASDLIGEETTK